MRITEQKVTTTYNITLDAADFARIAETLAKDEYKDTYKKNVFGGKSREFVKENMDEQAAKELMERMFWDGNGDTYTFIAKTLGFDGWYNAGYYKEEKGLYFMQLRNNGDCLN